MKEGKRRFVLIDQSVKKPGGHHYEYAQRILDAAKARGYDTLLLAHGEYSGKVSHEVRPSFSMTFWDNYSHYYGGAASPGSSPLFQSLMKPFRAINMLRLALKRRFLFSKDGLAFSRARRLRLTAILLNPHLDEDFSELPSSRLSLLAGWATIKAGSLARKLLALSGRFRLRGVLLLLCGILLAPIALPFIGLIWVRRRNPAKIFAREFRLAAGKSQMQYDQTVIFVPNATAAELGGLALLAKRGHQLAGAQWAFLYRRPVFSGYPAAYKQQMEAARRHRAELARLRSAISDDNVHFYSDTDELSAQYNLLGVYTFQTVPVPVELLPAKPAQPGASLVIGYLGDARDEKGFQHLPKLVESFVSRPCEGKQPHFLFQSNFNVPGGEPGSRFARSVLGAYESVELVHGPFDSKDYTSLLQRMDIVLIPYASENYSARSSGVLMEALSAGLPVLVPACSWMAGLVENARQRHILSLLTTQTPVKQFRATYDDVVGKPLTVGLNVDHVFVRLKFRADFEGYVRIAVTSINEFDIPLETMRMGFKATNGEVNAMFRKPNSCNMTWKVETLDSDTHPNEVEMQFFAAGRELPLGAGAALFDRAEDISRAVHELVDFYPHHKVAAEQLREDLRSLYDPAVLVERIELTAFADTRAATTLGKILT